MKTPTRTPHEKTLFIAPPGPHPLWQTMANARTDAAFFGFPYQDNVRVLVLSDVSLRAGGTLWQTQTPHALRTGYGKKASVLYIVPDGRRGIDAITALDTLTESVGAALFANPPQFWKV